MAGGSREQDKQVKVTIIETQFVKTDEANFKSVVQQFTGKDSMVAMAPRTPPMRPQARRAVPNPSRESEAQRAVPRMAQSQMEVPNASRENEAVTSQNDMANREAAFMEEDLEPFLEELYKFIDP